MTATEALREIPRLVPGDRGLPWIGRLLDYSRDPVGFYRHQWETYGPVSPFFRAPRAPESTQALHPLIWLARRWTSSRVVPGTPAEYADL